jgi:mercuric ion transport protein
MTEFPVEPSGAPATGWRVAGLFGGLATIFGGGAVFASSCCVVPLSLAALGATAATSGWIEALAPYHTYLLGFTGVAFGGGWLTFLRQNRASCAVDGTCAQPASRRRGAIVLGIATVVTLIAFGRGYFEPIAVGQLLGGA